MSPDGRLLASASLDGTVRMGAGHPEDSDSRRFGTGARCSMSCGRRTHGWSSRAATTRRWWPGTQPPACRSRLLPKEPRLPWSRDCARPTGPSRDVGRHCRWSQTPVCGDWHTLRDRCRARISCGWGREAISLPSHSAEWCGCQVESRMTSSSAIATLSDRVARLPRQDSCLLTPDDAWDDPGLMSTCEQCGRPLRFNPFIVDPADTRTDR